MGRLLPIHRVIVYSCSVFTFRCRMQDIVPRPGIDPGPPYLEEHGVLAIGQPGKSLLPYFKFGRFFLKTHARNFIIEKKRKEEEGRPDELPWGEAVTSDPQ